MSDGNAAGNIATDGGIGWINRVVRDERTFIVENGHEAFTPHDNGGRRSWIERRRFSYSSHIPERRSGIDRRFGVEAKDTVIFIERRGSLTFP